MWFIETRKAFAEGGIDLCIIGFVSGDISIREGGRKERRDCLRSNLFLLLLILVLDSFSSQGRGFGFSRTSCSREGKCVTAVARGGDRRGGGRGIKWLTTQKRLCLCFDPSIKNKSKMIQTTTGDNQSILMADITSENCIIFLQTGENMISLFSIMNREQQL